MRTKFATFFRVFTVLAKGRFPMNEDVIRTQTEVSHATFTRVRDDLVESGLVKIAKVGKTQFYKVTDVGLEAFKRFNEFKDYCEERGLKLSEVEP